MKARHRLGALTTLVVGLVVVLATAAQAAYHNSYDTIGSTPDYSPCSCTAAQGFAAGSSWLYSIKTNSEHTKSVIYRTNKSTGATSRMHNATSDAEYNTWLGHANDALVTGIGGQTYMFVVTMSESGGSQLVRLRYDGNNYTWDHTFKVTYNGAEKPVSGVSKVSTSSTDITFLFKVGKDIYSGSLPIGATGGNTIALTDPFTLNTSDAPVNGSPVPGIADWDTQGMDYDPVKKILYFPMWNGSNSSVVLMYRNITPSGQTSRPDYAQNLNPAKAYADPNTSFRITSSTYTKFEIESVGLSETKLYFGTNRSSSSGSADGVHVFDSYTSP